ncbi:hypothetical protein HERIO_286 [Hepatospora eriocheir]|uniref:Uncharacterized protein n=1 Tax=Hepatospora eriocheir TaxID=1081669 RepID=A0A1X0QDK8_9MICR|nr:hypothetical protein HERIO_286 [Hepatospora eriocheir]
MVKQKFYLNQMISRARHDKKLFKKIMTFDNGMFLTIIQIEKLGLTRTNYHPQIKNDCMSR